MREPGYLQTRLIIGFQVHARCTGVRGFRVPRIVKQTAHSMQLANLEEASTRPRLRRDSSRVVVPGCERAVLNPDTAASETETSGHVDICARLRVVIPLPGTSG
jgi:hypothetical protein